MEFYESGNKATCVCSYYDVIAVDSEIWFSYCCFSYEMKHVLFYGGGSLHFDGSTKCGEILVILLFRDEKRVFYEVAVCTSVAHTNVIVLEHDKFCLRQFWT